MSALNFNKDKSALIIIDVQQAFSEMAASGSQRNNHSAEDNISRLLSVFRAKNAAIFHIRHRNDAENSRFNRKNSGFQPIECALEQAGEPVIVKQVNSSFIGTDLEDRLRQAGIESVIICGATTNHCVETTTRMAGNLGFDTYLVHDATWTFDRTGPDGTVHKADAIQAMSLANLHDEFCTIADTASLSRYMAS
ncbi:cysteine hydrolase family protein [Paenochrobactrum sp. BZR 588]|uniref:cysteine hydrolase family protein n=1 Tax=Paenochrobactrum TaxID=999488 RepID=UPI0035BBA61E